MKILKILRTASLNSELTGSCKKMCNYQADLFNNLVSRWIMIIFVGDCLIRLKHPGIFTISDLIFFFYL